MSSEENNRHLWGSFPHQRAAGRGCCLARTSAAPGRAIPAPLAVPVTLTRVPALPRGHPGETCTTAKPKTGWKKVPKLLLSSPGSAMLTHCLCAGPSSSPVHSLPAQRTNSTAKPSTRNPYSPPLLTTWNSKPWLEENRSDTELCEPRRHREAWTARESQPRLNWGNAAVREVAAPWIPCQCSHPGRQHSHNMLMRPRGDTGSVRAVSAWHCSPEPAGWHVSYPCCPSRAPCTGTIWDSRVPCMVVQVQCQNCQSNGLIKVNWRQDT